MNSGLMLCIEPDWMDTLYDVHFENFHLFENLSEQFQNVLHQMLIGRKHQFDFLLIIRFCTDIRPFNIRSIRPAIGDTMSKHDARSTGNKTNEFFNWFYFEFSALSVCHRLVEVCWSALLGALTPMLTKNSSIESEMSSGNLVLSNTINEKLIETHELVFQGLESVFRLAVIVGKLNSILVRWFVNRNSFDLGLPNNACYVLHCVVSTIEQGWIMDNQKKIFTKQHRLHYLDVMAINFILRLCMNDINHCPNITYKHILR